MTGLEPNIATTEKFLKYPIRDQSISWTFDSQTKEKYKILALLSDRE